MPPYCTIDAITSKDDISLETIAIREEQVHRVFGELN
jgi:hypothetical protein